MVLERENYDAQKRVEMLTGFTNRSASTSTFSKRSIRNPGTASEMHKELTKALSAVDDARAEYSRSLPKISAGKGRCGLGWGRAGGRLPDGSTGAAEAKDFTYWLKAGFAFTLPLFAIGVILVIVLVAVFNR